MKKETEQFKQPAGKRFNDFFNNNRLFLIIVIAVMFIGLIGTVVTMSVINKNRIKTNITAEEIYDKYIDWIQADDNNKNRIEDELIALIDDELKTPSNSFSTQRAYYTKGQYYIEKEKWNEAAEMFYVLGTDFPKSYLAPVSLINAAGAYEMAGDLDKASECYKTVFENYKESSVAAPEVCFNLGRLSEAKGDKTSALEYYNTILSDYSESDWVNAANNRIISLNLDK